VHRSNAVVWAPVREERASSVPPAAVDSVYVAGVEVSRQLAEVFVEQRVRARLAGLFRPEPGEHEEEPGR
jgi:hypothetical protein